MTKHAELLEQIAKLQIQAEQARKKEIEAAVAQVNGLIAEFDLTPNDLAFKTSSRKPSARQGVSIKYRHGANTWTGRGRTPKWLSELEGAGK